MFSRSALRFSLPLLVLAAVSAPLPALAIMPVAPSTAVPSVVPQTQAEIKTSFASVVRKVAPTVVNISSTKVVSQQSPSFSGDPFFQMFFDNMFPSITQDRVERALGSGVIIKADGLFVTNYHVVKDAQQVVVGLSDRRELKAHLIDADAQLDLAVMQIELPEGETLPYSTFGDSDKLEVGDLVLAIGNPFGVGQSVSMGIVSALGRSTVGGEDVADFIQTDAAINPGNSGGALVDSQGRIVGINSAIFTRSGGSNGIGFAIPANVVKNVVDSVLNTGEVQRAWFGAAGQDLNMVLAEKLGLKTPNGVLLNEIVPDSPAAKAGVQMGDVIVAFNGQPVFDVRSLNARIVGTKIGSRISVDVWRGGQVKHLNVRLTPLPQRRPEDSRRLHGDNPLDGYLVEQLSPALAQQLGMSLSAEGVVVTEVPNGHGFGIRPGDTIVSINRREIRKLDDLDKVLSHHSRAWEIVYRRGSRIFRLFLQ